MKEPHGIRSIDSENAPRVEGGVAEVGGAEKLGQDFVAAGVRLEEEAAEG